MNIYIIFSAFTSRPTSLFASDRISVFFGIHVFVLSFDQKILHLIHLQYLMTFLDHPNVISLNEVEKQWR